ncbi:MULTISPECIES: iron-containing alcohol dehydrogenase family protein [Anaerolinea]|uniref:iron-containing alcohol dehydrogenase family protein n=1 Tax=Anaerolinea TaxID=233189 RepID=UPI00262B8E94|nr:iron-containing alcohol dehydrogenase [Anaerolinea thermophila]
MNEKLLEEVITMTADSLSVSNSYHFRVPPTTLVGDGISVKIGEYLEGLECHKVLIVTDRQIVQLGLMNGALRSLRRHKIDFTVFDEVLPDPTNTIVRRGVEALNSCCCDGVLAFGGGSVIDAGKAIAVFANNPLPAREVIKNNTKLSPRGKLIAVPTTAGTGSEVTDIAVITDEDNHIKVPHQHQLFIPDMAIIDPLLTLGIPPAITAATGMDVLTHAVESYMAKGVCTLGQALSYSAIQLVATYLPLAVGNGKDQYARRKMAEASYMAGMSFSNAGLGLCHAIAHQVGARYKIPHGVANALLLPEVMRFNMLVRLDSLREIARAFNLRVEHLDGKEAALKAIEAVRELTAAIGLPTRLEQVGARTSDFAALAAQAMDDPTLQTNPRQVCQADVIEVLQRSF